MLQTRQLGKRFGARTALRGLSFDVAFGQVAAVVGQNGAGKSTLLKIVAGLVRPTSGEMRWQNQAFSVQQSAVSLGLFAPDAPLYRELSCGENLRFFADVRGLKVSDEKLLAHLQNFNLQSRRDDLAGDLSSGLRARLQLAVAALHAPQLLLLDEPSANLDEAGRELLRDVLETQRRRGIALVATNDPRDLELCDLQIEL